ANSMQSIRIIMSVDNNAARIAVGRQVVMGGCGSRLTGLLRTGPMRSRVGCKGIHSASPASRGRPVQGLDLMISPRRSVRLVSLVGSGFLACSGAMGPTRVGGGGDV